MTVYLLIASPLAAGIICWAIGVDPRQWFAGTGKRRFTRESAAQLIEDKRVLESQLAEAQRPKPCPNCHHVPNSGWVTDAELAESDRSDPAPYISAPAPVDNGSRDTPLANADTQAVDVRDLRDAMGMGRTAVIPVIPVVAVAPPQQIPAGPGSTDPTEVSLATGRRAVVSVAAATTLTD